MNTKSSLTLLTVLVLLITACAPIIAGGSVPMDPVQPVDNEAAAIVPVTGVSALEPSHSISQEPQLWSGVISLSDNNSPDPIQNIQVPVNQNLQSECASEDSLPKDQSGCIE